MPQFGLDPGIYAEIEALVTAAMGEEQRKRCHEAGFEMTQPELLDLVASL